MGIFKYGTVRGSISAKSRYNWRWRDEVLVLICELDVDRCQPTVHAVGWPIATNHRTVYGGRYRGRALSFCGVNLGCYPLSCGMKTIPE